MSGPTSRYRCPACGHWCVWADDSWVCMKRGGCGSEWEPRPTWESVREHIDGSGAIVYWRLQRPDGTSIGAVSRKPEGWRALRYGGTFLSNTELGMHDTWQAARRAVEASA